MTTKKVRFDTSAVAKPSHPAADCTVRMLSGSEIRDAASAVHPPTADLCACGEKLSVLHFLRLRIEERQRRMHFGTARNYARTAASFARFLAGRELSLRELTDEVVGRYNIYLIERGVTRNTVSFYMRNLRAVYNHAVNLRLVEQTHPFRNVYTGVDRTRNRAVGSELVARLGRLDLPPGDALCLARDLFLFSFCTRGMAFVDIAYLRKTDIRGDCIRYARHKTGQPLSIRIEPCIRAILDRYRPAAAGTPYAFPILTATETSAAYREYLTALNLHNRQLRRLAALLHTECRLTSYTPRHSWATEARNHHIPLSVISAGLGHTSERTTQIYLATLGNSVIDCANRRILELLETTAAPQEGRRRNPVARIRGSSRAERPQGGEQNIDL